MHAVLAYSLTCALMHIVTDDLQSHIVCKIMLWSPVALKELMLSILGKNFSRCQIDVFFSFFSEYRV